MVIFQIYTYDQLQIMWEIPLVTYRVKLFLVYGCITNIASIQSCQWIMLKLWVADKYGNISLIR